MKYLLYKINKDSITKIMESHKIESFKILSYNENELIEIKMKYVQNLKHDTLLDLITKFAREL